MGRAKNSAPAQRARGPRCPMCDLSLALADDPRAPFCSPRCQRIDLGRWLGGDYRVPSDEPVDPWAVADGPDDDRFS